MNKIILSLILLGLIFPSLSFSNTESALEIAFKKEYAFLDQQRKSLDKQTVNFIKKDDDGNATLHRKLDYLKQQLVDVDLEVESKQVILEESALSVEMRHEDKGRLSQLYDQANASLDEKVSDKVSIDTLFKSALIQMKEKNRIRQYEGEYFLTDGEKVLGTIIDIGRVASFAVGNAGTGMLVPAGNGKMKLWKPENTMTAISLSQKMPLKSIELFLYEDRNQIIDEAKSKTVYEIVDSGGIIAWIIVVTGGIAILMVLLRIFFLKRASKGTDSLMLKIKDYIRNGQVKDAIKICENQRGAAARVVTSTLRNLDRERDHLEDVVAESILHENTYLNRYGAAILVVAAVAPLMGLLGTVTGMIETFDVITQFGTGDPKLLSVGISTALVTTQLGLIVAIPALVSGNLLSGWSNKIKDNMEQVALSVINVNALYKNNSKISEAI